MCRSFCQIQAQPRTFVDSSPPTESDEGAAIGTVLIAIVCILGVGMVVVDVVTYVDVAQRHLVRNLGHVVPFVAAFAVVEVCGDKFRLRSLLL